MGKVEDKYKPRSRFEIKISLGLSSEPIEVKKQVPKTTFLTQEDYYNFSRSELWSVCNFEKLVFAKYINDPSQGGLSLPPKKGSKRYKFLKLIIDAVKSGDLGLIYPKRDKEDPSHPLYGLANYNTCMVKAIQAWGWAVSMEAEGPYKLSPEFRKMHREIRPMTFERHIEKMPAWNVSQFVRILFGECYQDPAQWPENNDLKYFIDQIEAEIKVKKLCPLDSLSYEEIRTVSFLPLDLIKFWERYNPYLETLTWVKDLFLRIKSNANELVEKEQQAKPLPAALATRRAKTNALKARVFKIAKNLHNKGRPFTYRDIKDHPDWPIALSDCNLSRTDAPPSKTVRNWLSGFRKKCTLPNQNQ